MSLPCFPIVLDDAGQPGSGGQLILVWLNQDEVGKQTFNVRMATLVSDTAGADR